MLSKILSEYYNIYMFNIGRILNERFKSKRFYGKNPQNL